MKIKISKKLYNLAQIFGQENPLFVVGGYVRNQLLKTADSDIDLACNLKLDQVAELLKNTKYNLEIKNLKLGTALISRGKESYEYSTFRNEFYKGEGEHSPDVISFDASIVEDAKRRDFTINSLYYNILSDEICDFYGGLEDLSTRHIRTVEDAEFVMQNDGVRILRMVRLACELNFFIDKDTLAAAKNHITNLQSISQDRLRHEVLKIIFADLNYHKTTKKVREFSQNLAFNGIKLLDKLNAWGYLVKKNADLISNLQGIGSHLTSFAKAKCEDLLVSFCFDSLRYLNQCKHNITPSEFCSNFLGVGGLNFKKAEYENILNVLNNLTNALELDYFDEQKVKLFCVKTLKTSTCTELRLLQHVSKSKYKVLFNMTKSCKGLPNDISMLKFDVEKFHQQNPNFNKSRTTQLLNKLLNAVILGEVKNSHKDLIEYLNKSNKK